jgi:hypothetical protein
MEKDNPKQRAKEIAEFKRREEWLRRQVDLLKAGELAPPQMPLDRPTPPKPPIRD